MKKMESEKSRIIVFGIEQSRRSVLENLNSENFEILFLSNIVDLFSSLDEESYDLILLLDLENETNAIRACKLIKSNLEYNNTPVIFFSFNSAKRLIIEAFDAGADDFVAYPVDWFELKDKIDLQIFMGKKHYSRTGSYRENQKNLQLVTQELTNLKNEIYSQFINHETRQRIC